ncbi:hypothetical protein ACIRPK_26935 [Kitasatospora sp. NPDC101801]|uniref:hypothetical protein n=1 Tax=Kitasatospora sp. NPDC101801 TaxID=3364103 RepID=UPI0037FA0B3B
MDDTTWQRVYGTDPDHPSPGPEPDGEYRELRGGPLDGQLVDVRGWNSEQLSAGAYLLIPGNTERADYEPRPGDPTQWDFQGNVPC